MKIPKIILILVIIALLFVSCDDAIPLDPEDAELIAVTGFMSTFLPIIIITDEMEAAGRYDFDDFDGIDFNELEFTVTWDNFDIFEVATDLNGYPDPVDELIELLDLANNIGIFDKGQLVITSGNAKITDAPGNIVVNANFNLKIDVDVPDVPKGTFNVIYKLTIVNAVPESIEIFVNNQKVEFDFD